MGGTTPVWQLPYPVATDPADGPDGFLDLASRLETVLTSLKTGGAIPGEIRMWSGNALPAAGTFGHWAWCDGTAYPNATYPIAAGNIAVQWRTAHGQADPGAANFRVPDLRGLAPTGLDAMPGGARANRTTRAVAITIAGRTGEEYHTVSVAEMPAHAHAVSDGTHNHALHDPQHGHNISDPTHAHSLPGASLVGGGGPMAGPPAGGDLHMLDPTSASGTGIG